MNKPVIKKIEFTEEEQDIIKRINECQPVQSVRTKVSKDGVKTDIITHTRFTYATAKKHCSLFTVAYVVFVASGPITSLV